jgi:hypothetical protein
VWLACIPDPVADLRRDDVSGVERAAVLDEVDVLRRHLLEIRDHRFRQAIVFPMVVHAPQTAEHLFDIVHRFIS